MLFTRNFFTKEQTQRILKTIEDAENNTSGEIRVHLETHCRKADPLERAKEVFAQLNMHKTALRNGILFYFAVDDKKFAVFGDEGIHQKVTDAFWEEVKNHMVENFKEEKFTEGLANAIESAGQQLKHFFPREANDTNELTNDISIGN